MQQQQQQAAGGRVSLIADESCADYPLFDELMKDETDAALGSLRQVDVRDSAVGTLFFSPLNIAALQEATRYGVNRASLEAGAGGGGFVIGNQSERELGIVMRGMYQQFARNLPTQVLEQVRALNVNVLQFTVPRILQEVMSYRQYRIDISRPASIMGRGQIAGTKGDKQLGLRAT